MSITISFLLIKENYIMNSEHNDFVKCFVLLNLERGIIIENVQTFLMKRLTKFKALISINVSTKKNEIS